MRTKTKPRGQMALEGCGLDESLPVKVIGEHPAFKVFWNAYPRKVARYAAVKAFSVAVTQEQPEVIIAALLKQAEAFHASSPRFTPHAATWLRGKRWMDEVKDIAPRELTPAEQLTRRMVERYIKEGKV